MLNNKAIFFIIGLVQFFIAQAQLEDKYVVMGGAYPTAIFAFENDTLIVDTATLIDDYYYWRAQGSICNKQGELQFYTNGYVVFNKQHAVMEGGDSITFSNVAKLNRALGFGQNCLIFRKPESEHLYYLIIFDFVDNCNGTNSACVLQYAEIDMSQNNGLGKVISTNNKLLETPISKSKLTACRHANGRDWWVVKQEFGTNKWFKFLLTPQGFQGPFSQNIGGATPEASFDGGTYAVFSNYGNYFVNFSGQYFTPPRRNTLEIMDFDRCTGLMSNVREINIEVDSFAWHGCSGLSFSPSDQYLYLIRLSEILQIDMWSNDWQGSMIKVADISNEQFYFEKTYLAPDGKIYIGNSCGAQGLTVINNPEERGMDCNITYNNKFGVLPITYCGGAIPNMPNFKLGALPGPCDTVYNKPEPIPTAILFPTAFTPNGDNLNDVFIPSHTGTISNYELKIYNRWGNMVFNTNNIKTGWDGTYNNTIKTDTYTWYCTYTNYNNEVKLLKGNVTLVK